MVVFVLWLFRTKKIILPVFQRNSFLENWFKPESLNQRLQNEILDSNNLKINNLILSKEIISLPKLSF